MNNFDKEIKEFFKELESNDVPYYISDESNLVCNEFVEQRFQLNMGNGDTHVIHFIEGDDYDGVCISSESSYYGDAYSLFYYLCDADDAREFWLNIKGKRVEE